MYKTISVVTDIRQEQEIKNTEGQDRAYMVLHLRPIVRTHAWVHLNARML